MASHPLLQIALERLDLDLEQELQRYRNYLGNESSRSLSQLNPTAQESIGANQDFEFAFDSLSEIVLDESILAKSILDRSILDKDTQDTDLSNLDDLSLEWESSLDEEFQGQLPVLGLETEFTQISTDISAPDDRTKESTPNLLSPLGVIAMILLLISSATVGYLLVDSSGLYRLIRQEDKPKPVSLSDGVELFQTKTIDSDRIPFVDFTSSRNKSNEFDKLNELPQLQPPIGLGRSFETPIRVEPEIKFESKPRTPKVVKSNSQPSSPQPLKPKKIDKNPNLELDPEPTLEEPSNPSAARSPSPIRKIPVPTSIISNPVGLDASLESPKPQLNSNTEIKSEVKTEVTQESD